MSARRAAEIPLILTLALASGCAAPIEPPARIILFSMDTVRADRVTLSEAPAGPSGPTMPVLGEIAARGFSFQRAYAMSNYTLPSHMSIFTGLDPAEHGVHRMFAALNPDTPTLAGLLRDAGYRTQAFHEGGFVAARFGFDRGFDAYERLPLRLATPAAVRLVLDWMRSAGDAPYFLFLHTYAAHFPYGGYERYRREHPERGLPSQEELRRRDAQLEADPDPELRYLCTVYNQLAGRRKAMLGCGEKRPGAAFPEHPGFASDLAAIRRSYDARVATIDPVAAAIRGLLVDLGQWEETLLVVTSDHGEAFYEHGQYRHAFVPFDEVMRVPLVISYPRLSERRADANGNARAMRIDGLVTHLDLLPTILSLAGIEQPGAAQGMDLSPVLRGEASIPADRAVFPATLRAAQMPQVPLRRIVVQGGHKRIDGHDEFGDAEGLLFDLARDPPEHENRRESRRDEFARLGDAARRYEAGLRPRSPLDQRTGLPLVLSDLEPDPLDGLDAEERKHLRSLGYVE